MWPLIKTLTEYLFQNTLPSLSNTQLRFWSLKRKSKAWPTVWKPRSNVWNARSSVQRARPRVYSQTATKYSSKVTIKHWKLTKLYYNKLEYYYTMLFEKESSSSFTAKRLLPALLVFHSVLVCEWIISQHVSHLWKKVNQFSFENAIISTNIWNANA